MYIYERTRLLQRADWLRDLSIYTGFLASTSMLGCGMTFLKWHLRLFLFVRCSCFFSRKVSSIQIQTTWKVMKNRILTELIVSYECRLTFCNLYKCLLYTYSIFILNKYKVYFIEFCLIFCAVWGESFLFT